jgi:peptide/nickel transport system ATP-binding protein
LLACDRLTVEYSSDGVQQRAVNDLSFHIGRGEAFGLVGESGCGKSTVALAIMRHLGPNGTVAEGAIRFDGTDLLGLGDEELRRIRGGRIAMVYQDPLSSLNPVMTIGRQLMEVPLLHRTADRGTAQRLVAQALTEVELSDPEMLMSRYPHQLSGGQQQRCVIAMAMIAEPALLILDEPTTGLDVTVEAAVLDLVDRLRRRRGTAVLFISHNLGAVSRLCDRMGVLYAGRLVEQGPLAQVLRNPRHPYTRGLLNCVPTVASNSQKWPLTPIGGSLTDAARLAVGCAFADRCGHVVKGPCTSASIELVSVPEESGHVARCVRSEALAPFEWRRDFERAPNRRTAAETILKAHALGKRYQLGRSAIEALSGIDVELERGRTLAIVGESGSGKSTFARILIGISAANDGELNFHGQNIAQLPIGKRSRDLRQRLQMIFQNPDSTLNPSHTVGNALRRTVRRLRRLGRADADAEVSRLLQLVQLPAHYASRMPDQLSGGQRQRISIARALAAAPEVVIADEPVSALDVSVQAAVANLLKDLQERQKLSLVFISHDIALVSYMADYVALFYRGQLMEFGAADTVFAPPYHPYTQMLLAAVPDPNPDFPRPRLALREFSASRPHEAQRACPFTIRCPYRVDGKCDSEKPPIMVPSAGHRIACHLSLEELPRDLVGAYGGATTSVKSDSQRN